ncbi:enoyl-CoA hydratase/isomerase family protein [Leucobacter sp. G161]|uniref:enoyl-CoA hydratase/isomerase family protein n=1 Tax=Leucobacter sp. G161 TaxID=663704 RepID=UPI00073C9E7A|nr:enoyl-CoA hydratase/isomerase family protein [Leucobacter sp. G161]KUF08558.1 hypothetical protein AUL38_00135 [Leucobacter sp. G161]
MNSKDSGITSTSGAIRYERNSEGIVTLTLDNPHGPVNVMDEPFEAALGAVVDRLHEEVDQTSGVILASAKKSFLAGGDLNRLASYTAEHTEEQVESIDAVKRHFRALETLGIPVVSTINGSALGGGLEFALATHYRIAADVKDSKIGLPEIGFGLLPGAGGLTRAVYMFGLKQALYKIVLPATRFTVAEAHELGLVDEVVDTIAELRPRALEWIRKNPAPAKAWDLPGFELPGGIYDADELRRSLPEPLADAALRPRFPAPAAAIIAAAEGAATGIDVALHIESRYLIRVATGQVTKNMIHALFFDSSAVSRGVKRPVGFAPRRLVRVRLTGTGHSATLLRHALEKAGVEVRTGTSGSDDAQMSLTELPPRGMAGQKSRERTISYQISIGNGAPDTASTQLLLFSPVENFRLLQIVETPDSDQRAIGLAYDLADALNKQAILTKNTPESFGERLINRLHSESQALMSEGLTLEDLHQVVSAAGFSGESAVWLPTSPTDPQAQNTALLSPCVASDAEDRLLFAAAITALKAVSEGNIGSTAEANIASFLAVGYPVWTGGAVRFATQYQDGTTGFRRRSNELKHQHGERFDVGEVISDG